MDPSRETSDTFVCVLKALLRCSEEHGEKNVPIVRLKALLDHYNL